MPTAVITGSSSGIGFATAKLLVSQGYSVVLHAQRNLDGLQLAARELQSSLAADAKLLCITADISNSQSCRDLVQACFHWNSSIDLWVNNAGVDVLTGLLSQLDFEEKLERLLKVDVMGTVRLSRLVAQRMLAETDPTYNPSIINIGWDQSALGMEGDPGQMFGPTKAAVTAFTSSLALTVAPKVRVNTVAPGWIRTAWGQQSASDYWNQRAIAESQLQRWGTPEDVAATIAWLASPTASFISGQVIQVNGGRRFYPVD